MSSPDIPWSILVYWCDFCGAACDACSFYHRENTARLICGRCHKYHKHLDDGIPSEEEYDEFENSMSDAGW